MSAMHKNLLDEGECEVADDMVNLQQLEVTTMVTNLRKRYEVKKIYVRLAGSPGVARTYIGNILIALNPYKELNSYGLDMVKKYNKHQIGSLPPHLFAIGNAAYSNIVDDGEENQVIVISGESGAGKTESTKLLMHFLAVVCNKGNQSCVTERILEANPLLESFGNAKTFKNDNSSRFGKYVELYFTDGLMVGSKTTEYLLERSRIVKQIRGERNYHIFYEIIKGLSPDQKLALHLTAINDFAYLNYGEGALIESRNDENCFRNIELAFHHHNFTNEEKSSIFKILSSVLHLGNVVFKNVESEYSEYRMDSVVLANEVHGKIVSELLDVPFEGLTQVLTMRVTEARSEKMHTPLTQDQALDVRDAIAKALYHHLFTWLVSKINLNSKCDDKLRNISSIAVLDIFGFEDLDYNGFEQLCINYANESLQYYFNRHIFKIEQEEYEKEGVSWFTIDFIDNQPVVDLIGKRSYGIFSLLDDESYFPNGSDRSFLEKCHQKLANNNYYVKPKMSNMEFSVKHYAGQVTYDASEFLDKNRDTLKNEVVGFLKRANQSFLSGLFKSYPTINVRCPTMGSKTSKSVTISSFFDDSLQSLLETMTKCNPWFIRCIKPNHKKMALVFESDLVLNQLRASGMLETVKIRKMGYSIRMKFEMFFRRFKSLLPQSHNHLLKNAQGNIREICISVLQNQSVAWKNSWEAGQTKVFMKENLLGHLLEALSKALFKVVLVFQKYARGFLARLTYRKFLRTVIDLQSECRGFMARRKFKVLKNGIISAQAQVRKMFAQRSYKQMKVDYKEKNNENKRRRGEKIKAEQNVRMSKILEDQVNKGIDLDMLKEKFSYKIDANSLVIPTELACQISQADGLTLAKSEKDLAEVKDVAIHNLNLQLPKDVDTFDFIKYAEVYCPETLMCVYKSVREEPILSMSPGTQQENALNMSKLIVRYLLNDNDTELTRRLSINFIISKCLNNDYLKDEILLQICNKTFIRKDPKVLNKAWLLLTLCAGCFQPSVYLVNYLIKYASNYCIEPLASICQQNLLRGFKEESNCSRSHPPCYLEWAAANRNLPMALPVSFYDGINVYGEVDSWKNAEEFGTYLFQLRKILEGTYGWALELVHSGWHCYMAGIDFVFDAVNQAENHQKLLNTTGHFLVYFDGGKNNSRGLCNFENMSQKPVDMTGITELKEFVPAAPRMAFSPDQFFKFSCRRDEVYARRQDQQGNQEKLYEKVGLAKSRLNARYVESDNYGIVQQTGSSSMLDLRTILSTDKEKRRLRRCQPEVPHLYEQIEPGSDVVGFVSQVFRDALGQEESSNELSAEQISKKIKGNDENLRPAERRPKKPSPSPISPGNTELNELDDRDYFDLSQMNGSNLMIHSKRSQSHLTYNNPSWQIFVRKELFTHNDTDLNPSLTEMIYKQIISDLEKKNCIRITEEDKSKLKVEMKCRDLDFITKKLHSPEEKKSIINLAKDWPYYFSRIFHVSGGSRMKAVQLLGVSHAGIKLLNRVKTRDGKESLNTIESIRYQEIVDVCNPQLRTLQIHYKTDQYVALYLKQEVQAMKLIEAFCIECETNSVFVKAIQSYRTNESMLLSFKEGDIIKLTNKNQELEKGWYFGTAHGRAGMFPCEYVVPIANHQVAYVEFKMLQINATLDRDAALYERINEPLYNSIEDARKNYCMLDYCLKNFRKPLPNLKKNLKVKHGPTDLEMVEKIKWSKSPIEDSLTLISSDKLNKHAVACFKNIMEYMNDLPLMKGKSSSDPVISLMYVCREFPDLHDEVYCQIVKQLTTNRSPKADSLQQGWRLLFLISSFFCCSEQLRPYLIKFIEQTALDNRRSFCKLAGMCLQNLRQTMRFGGRIEMPSKAEISSITLGRFMLKVKCSISGGFEAFISIQAGTVAGNAVEQMCENIGVRGKVECLEYIIYVIHGTGQSLFPLDDSTYMMDVLNDFSNRNKTYQLLFCRFTWVFPLQDNPSEMYINLMFEQIKPEYLDGFFLNVTADKVLEHVKENLINLCCLLMNIDDVDEPMPKKITGYLPKNARKLYDYNRTKWTEEILSKYKNVKKYTSVQCKHQFLVALSRLPLFGSTFFLINSTSNSRFRGKSLLAVNRRGLTFLSEKNMDTLWEIPLQSVLSARVHEGSPKPTGIDLKYGNLLNNVTIQLHTSNPHPVGLLIHKYIQVCESFKSLTGDENLSPEIVAPSTIKRDELYTTVNTLKSM